MADYSWIGEAASAVGTIVSKINWNKKSKGTSSNSANSENMADYIKDPSGRVIDGQAYIPTLSIPPGMYVGIDGKVWDMNPTPTSLVGARTGAKNQQSVLDKYDLVGRDAHGNDLHLLKPQYMVKPMNPQPTIQSNKNVSGMGNAVGGIFDALGSIFGNGGSTPAPASNQNTVGNFFGALLPFAIIGGVGYFGYKLYKKKKR